MGAWLASERKRQMTKLYEYYVYLLLLMILLRILLLLIEASPPPYVLNGDVWLDFLLILGEGVLSTLFFDRLALSRDLAVDPTSCGAVGNDVQLLSIWAKSYDISWPLCPACEQSGEADILDSGSSMSASSIRTSPRPASGQSFQNAWRYNNFPSWQSNPPRKSPKSEAACLIFPKKSVEYFPVYLILSCPMYTFPRFLGSFWCWAVGFGSPSRIGEWFQRS